MTLVLERTPDVLGEVGRRRTNSQLVVGFAAETEDLVRNAEQKLSSKNLDMIVANDVSRESVGFDSDSNEVTILVRGQPEPIIVPMMSKLEVADKILDELVRIRRRSLIAKSADQHES